MFFLTTLAPASHAGGGAAVTFPAGGAYWCWVRSAAGPVTAGPVEAGAGTMTLSAPAAPGDVLVALDTRTGRTASRPLESGQVVLTSADFRDPDRSAAVPGLGGLAALLAGLLVWQAARRRPPGPAPAPPASEQAEQAEDAPGATRGPALPLPAPAAGLLVGIQGLVAGGRFALTSGDVRVGRDGDNDIVLAENLVSRRHARLRRDAQGRFTLTDLGSANGVHVNGMRVERALLTSGDEIKIGDNFFRFQIEEYTEKYTQEQTR